MIQTKRFIARVKYKVLNVPTNNVVVIPANDYPTARRVLTERYNSNGMQLLNISLREINTE